MYSELLKYSRTFGPMKDDFFDWHQGRLKYAVWILEVNDAQFLERYHSAQQHLSSYLIADYARKPHITLAICGFLSEDKKLSDDYDSSSISQDIDCILALGLTKIEVSICNALISYAIAPGFVVHDSFGQLQQLNNVLNHNRAEDSLYFPHVTVGLYNREWPTEDIVQALKLFPIGQDIQLSFDAVKLVSYQPTISGGQLTDELIINLSDQTISDYP